MLIGCCYQWQEVWGYTQSDVMEAFVSTPVCVNRQFLSQQPLCTSVGTPALIHVVCIGKVHLISSYNIYALEQFLRGWGGIKKYFCLHVALSISLNWDFETHLLGGRMSSGHLFCVIYRLRFQFVINLLVTEKVFLESCLSRTFSRKMGKD